MERYKYGQKKKPCKEMSHGRISQPLRTVGLEDPFGMAECLRSMPHVRAVRGGEEIGAAPAPPVWNVGWNLEEHDEANSNGAKYILGSGLSR